MIYYHYTHSLKYVILTKEQDKVTDTVTHYLNPIKQGEYHKPLLLVTKEETPIFCDLVARAIFGLDPLDWPFGWYRFKVKVKLPLLRIHYSHPSWIKFLDQCRIIGLSIDKLYWTVHRLPVDPNYTEIEINGRYGQGF